MPITAASLVVNVGVSGATAAQEQLAQLGNSASQAQSKLNQMQQGEGEASTSLGGRFAGAVKGSVSGLLNFGTQVGMTVMGFKGLYDGAVGLASGLLSSNASMEQTRVAFTTLLGSSKAAGDYLQQLQQFAASTPFEFPEVATAAQHMIAFGFSAKDVLPALTDIGDAMSAMGKSSADVDHIVEIFGQMKAAGKVSAQDMMQMASEGIPAWKYLAEAMGKTVPEVQKLSSQGLIPADTAIKAIEDGMHKAFGGGMQAQAMTFNGLLSTFKDNVGMAWRAFTGPLFDAAKQGLVVLGNLVSSKQFQDFAQNTGKQLAAVFGQIGQVISSDIIPALRPLLPIFVSIGETAQGAFKQISDIVGGVFQQHMKTASTITQELGNWFNTSLVPALHQAMPGFQSLANTIMTVVVPGLARLWTIGQEVADRVFPPLVKIIEAALPVLIRLAGIISAGLSEALKFLMPYILQAAQAIGQFAGEIAQRVAPIVINFFHNVSEGLTAFQRIWSAVWPVLAPILKGVWDEIVGVIKIAWALVSGIIKIGLDLLSGNWKQAWDDFKDMLRGVWDGIKTYLQGAWEILVGLFGGFVSSILSKVASLGTTLSHLWTDIKNIAVGAWNWIINTINEDIAFLVNYASSHLSGLLTTLSHLWTDMKNTAVGAWNWIRNTVSYDIELLQNFIAGKANDIKNAILKPFQDAGGAIGGVVRGMANTAIDMLNGMLRQVHTFLADFADAIDSVASAVGAGRPVGVPPLLQIGHLAQGTDSWPGGLAVVGEQGPELAFLPRGTAVLPAKPSAVMRGLLPGLAAGIDIGSIFNWFTGGASNVFANVFHSSLSLPGSFSEMANGLMGKIHDWGISKITGVLNNMAGAIFGPSFGGGGASGDFGRPVTGNVASWVAQAIGLTGVPMSWLSALVAIAMHESGGNPLAANNWDINAINGDPSRGLMQTIGATFAAYAFPGHGNIFNPVDNAAAAIRYISSRYGSVFNVPGIASMARGGPYIGYADGTSYAPGGLGIVGERGPELMYIPRGAQIVPNTQLRNGAPTQIIVQPPAVYLDGRILANGLMPHITSAIRYGTGVR